MILFTNTIHNFSSQLWFCFLSIHSFKDLLTKFCLESETKYYHEWQFSFHLTNVLYMYYNRSLTEFVSAIVQKSYNGIPIPYTNMIDILGWNVKIVMSFSQPPQKSGKLHMNHVVGSIWTRHAGIATSAMPPNYYFVV